MKMEQLVFLLNNILYTGGVTSFLTKEKQKSRVCASSLLNMDHNSVHRERDEGNIT